MEISPIIMAMIATIFTWFVTLIGSSIVFFFKKINQKLLDIMLSISSGIMIAASFWSLLSPAIVMCEHLNMNKAIIPSLGIICGGLLIIMMDYYFSIKLKNNSNKKKRCMLLLSSITLHNIPEGLCVGVAFGSLPYNLDGITIGSAIALTIGIAIQNFPEGGAVSIPLRCEGMSRKKAFFYGQLSAIVEPIAGIIGALLVFKIRTILPFCLSFAAGAMLYVVAKELIPESNNNDNNHYINIYLLIGFIIMMVLDVLLG